jgi:hypothetical protein
MRQIGALKSGVYSAWRNAGFFLAKKKFNGETNRGDKPCSAARQRKHTKLRGQQDGFVS